MCIPGMLAVLSLAGPFVDQPVPDFSVLPRATVTLSPARDQLTVEFTPTDLPASSMDGMDAMISLPVHQVIIPESGSLHSVQTEVVDSAGQTLPRGFLHHVNLTDPGHRDLFLSSSLHILAASKETPAVSIPELVLGLPLERGQRLLAYAMINNPTRTAHHGLRVRVTLGYRATHCGSPFPLLKAYPWVLDAMFPLGQRPGGSKAFDLPPGRSERSWESSPAIPGYLLGAGGHVHDYAIDLSLTDATTGEVIFHAVPVKDRDGHVLSMPVQRFYRWYRLGLHIVPSHRYRITVRYNNPTDHTLRAAGMGAVGGLFVPDRGTHWPAVDTADAVYREDLANVFVPEHMEEMAP